MSTSAHPSSRHGFASEPASGGRKVVLVGAGIVNLVTARALTRAGFEVEIVEASPDPRTKPDWRLLGSSAAGANARMWSLTEATNYNEKDDPLHPEMHAALRRPVREGGWLLRPPTALAPADQRFIADFERLPASRAWTFAADVHRINRASGELWQRMRRESPELFHGVAYRPGILGLYHEERALTAARRTQEELGGLERALGVDELARRHPALRAACEAGEIAGGLELRGFTLAVHDFMARLLEELEAAGVGLRWQTRAERLLRGDGGAVEGLLTSAGVVRADHWVISPGAHGEELLRGTRTAGKIRGVLGLWITLPAAEPRLERSLKIHREGHVGENSNLLLGRDENGEPLWILGAGYALVPAEHVDGRFLEPGSPEIEALYQALEETLRRFLPHHERQARRAGRLRRLERICVRPFTSTGLGVFEVLPASSGGRAVITGGHNTGGFAQAPAVAEAVRSTLLGEASPLGELYDPDRGRGEELDGEREPRDALSLAS